MLSGKIKKIMPARYWRKSKGLTVILYSLLPCIRQP